ncbi:MAG: AEC family transporter, partial [Bdellovibrionota bacterium]
MGNFLLILVCLVLGYVVRRATRSERSRVRPLNLFVLWVSLPAVILTQLPGVFENEAGFTLEALCLAGMPWLVFALTTLAAMLAGAKFGWSKATIGAIALTAGFGNTSFVGFPLLEAFYGPEALALGIVVDQAGTFLALSTVGLAVASYFSTRSISFGEGLRRMITFPPLIAVVVASLWGIFELPESEFLNTILRLLGKTLAPLALIAVGWQIEFDPATIRRRRRELMFGLGMKLVVSPTVICLLANILL